MSSRLELRNIFHQYSGAPGPVLKDLGLTVEASRTVALLGTSGSGKSTLLRVVAGLTEPTSGQVFADGQDLTGIPPERRGIALVFQKPLLFPHLNVVDNVGFSARMAGVPTRTARAQAREFLNLVQLQDFAHRRPAQLSGGQEQRVSLARALARHPRLLLLDEPFSSLDSRLRDDMYQLLSDIRKQLEPTVVLVTHDRREAAVLADSIAVLESGRILAHGPVSQVHYRPASLAVSRILGGLNEIPGVVTGGIHHSVLGSINVPQARDGFGFLVIRQETISLVPAGSGVADAFISSIKPLGAHSLAALVIADSIITDHAAGEPAVQMWAEIAGNLNISTGERVGVRFDSTSAWVVNS